MTIPEAHKEFIIRQASVRIERLEVRMLAAKLSVEKFREKDKINKR